MENKVPLADAKVAAGTPFAIESHADSNLSLDAHLISHPAATFFIRVEGDSMQGAGIYSGDLLIVDRAITPKNRSVIIAELNGELTVKRLYKKGNRISLLPENPKYKPIEVSAEDQFEVWGTVTYVIHKP